MKAVAIPYLTYLAIPFGRMFRHGDRRFGLIIIRPMETHSVFFFTDVYSKCMRVSRKPSCETRHPYNTGHPRDTP